MGRFFKHLRFCGKEQTYYCKTFGQMRRFSCFGVSAAMRRCFPYILCIIIHATTITWRICVDFQFLEFLRYEGPAKSFVTGFGLLQSYVLSNIFLLQTFKVFPLY